MEVVVPQILVLQMVLAEAEALVVQPVLMELDNLITMVGAAASMVVAVLAAV